MIIDAFSLCLRPVMFALDWFTTIFDAAGAVPAFVAMFAACVVARVVIRPLVGYRSQSTKSSDSGGNS